MPNTLSPTPQNPSYSNSTSIVQGYSLNGANGIASYDVKVTLPIMTISFDGALDIKLVFTSSENSQDLKLEFAPDPTMNVPDLTKIMLLAQLAQSGGLKFKADVLAYVRKNNLERHFKFTVV